MAKRGGHTEKADATRRQLLDAALAVIGEKGYSAATVDEIVEAAGVSKGVAYYHFKSKAAMAESILEDGLGELIEGFERIAAAAPDAPAALTGMVELFATRIFENKAFGRFFVSELWRENRVWSGAMRGFEGRLLAVLEGQLARGQREGIIRPGIDPAFEAVAIVGMVLTTTLYYLGENGPLAGPARSVGKDAFIERICDFVRHANARPGALTLE
ncbi:TetR/AcrR family transcriptional regulator [Arabiibacter massiliensis]|uniref:TetR/AcrR family transcriptional regulator n=1 Tax=Arabiibacter massiliensis TaxID=1870985 RepID=UPI0009BB24CA|nr:TetR/AcrR family transcriptional regulator [Arabiibacter massiliensis]